MYNNGSRHRVEDCPISQDTVRFLRRFITEKFKISGDSFALKHLGKTLSQMTEFEGKQLLKLARNFIK